jgi:hypothetical protein
MDKYAVVVPIGHDLIAVADALVESRNVAGLSALGALISNLITVANIADEKISITEVGEYIDEALDLFARGESADCVKSSSIRKLLANC